MITAVSEHGQCSCPKLQDTFKYVSVCLLLQVKGLIISQ